MNADANQCASGNWSAGIELGFRPGPGRTLLAHRKRYGPLAVQRPFYPEGGVCHVYLLHPPGGVVGGDQLDIRVATEQGASALLTTPGATKFYRSARDVAHQEQYLRVQGGASLEWLPQENIFFPGAQVRMRTHVDLLEDARIALWEIHCLGRPAAGEVFDQGSLDAGLEVRRDGRLLLHERLRVDPETRRRLSLLAGQPVTATALFSDAGDEHLQLARELLQVAEPVHAGATLIGDLLVLRYLGDSTERARSVFTRIWSALRELLLDRGPSRPRIWAT